MSTRSGFVALAGRPNVGKSTLLNRLVGEKVAIVSDRPQTTRRAIRGVATGPDWQLVVVDLPGVQRPRDALTARMQGRMEREMAGSDAALLVLAGDQGVGPGDRFIARAHALVAGEHEQRGVGAGQLALHTTLHTRGERVAWTLHSREVDHHQLPVRPGGDAADRAAGRLRAVGDDRHLLPHEAVEQRGLADVRPAGQRDEP